PSHLHIGREMEHAVATLDPTEAAAADHHAARLEMARHRLARRIVDEVHVTGELSRRDVLRQVGRRLEYALIRRLDVLVPDLDLHEGGRLERGLNGFLGENAEMDEQASGPGLDKSKSGAINRSPGTEFAAEIGELSHICGTCSIGPRPAE